MAALTADEQRFEGFLAEFLPPVAQLGRAAVAHMRARLPSADVVIYDNYNFLVAGFVPGERISEAVFSVALYARGVNLFFLDGVNLPDPGALLAGAGKSVRHVALASEADLERPDLRELIEAAIARANPGFDPERTGRFFIKSVSAKKRPRRPS